MKIALGSPPVAKKCRYDRILPAVLYPVTDSHCMKRLRADRNGYGKQVQSVRHVPALTVASIIEKNVLHRLSAPHFERCFTKGGHDPVIRIQGGCRSNLGLLSLDRRKSSYLALPLKDQHPFIKSSPKQHGSIEFEQQLVR
jgi:hypothetical protein